MDTVATHDPYTHIDIQVERYIHAQGDEGSEGDLDGDEHCDIGGDRDGNEEG